MKKRIYIAAVNQRYGFNVFLPYAAGLMWAHARQFPEIADAYELGHAPGTGMLFLKEPIDKAIARMESPDVVAFSSYIWNHEWNKALAAAVKEKWPECVTLVGGVQVPDASPRILEECPMFDFAVYGEGEGSFADFLTEHATNERVYGRVGSLVRRTPTGVIVNPRHAEVQINTIPSPYIEGVFDDLIKNERWNGWQWQALQETNRGCPYSCSFCAWGVGSLSKVRQFPLERIRSEYWWMASKHIEFLYNCDANYGILRRDVDLVRELTSIKASLGYPKKFRAAFAKNSNDVVFEISEMLARAGMLKATTLALQSMKEETLGLIKRKNIKYDKLAELSARYEAAGISTYAEVIVGLPGETYDSFVDGLDALLDAGQHDGVSIYLCMLLENTEMTAPEYRRAHGIESVPMKALLYHGTPEPGVVEEIQETVVATATMSREDLKRAVLYGWVLQALHSFGLTQHLARELKRAGLIRNYSNFYSAVIEWWRGAGQDSVGAEAYRRVEAAWDAAVCGESWPTVDPRYGDVMWPPEELLFLDIACQARLFYDELGIMLSIGFNFSSVPEKMLDEQLRMFIPPEPGREEEYAREACWYGRKGPGRKLRLRGKE